MTVALTDSDRRLALRVVKARERLLDFTTYTFPTYQRSYHLDRLAEELEAVERGDSKRLMIFMPPQHGKSELVSVRFPAWFLCRNPTKRYIMASYGEDLASDFGGQVRNIVAQQPLFPKVRLAADSKAKDLWKVEGGGFLRAVGIGSGVIGRGADIISIDDPYKKREEAYSESYRRKIRGWYRTEIYTRRQPECAIILILHRWHEADLAGSLLAEAAADPLADQWRILRLPAVAEAGDILGRPVGEALWKDKFTEGFLAQQRRGMDEAEWNALYQQRPAPEEGAIFKWFPRYQEVPPLKQVVVGIDTAYTGEASSDYTAWAVWGFDGSRAFLLEADRFKGEVPDAERRITATIWRLQQQHQGVPVKALVRSAVAIDRIAAQHLRRGVATVGVAGNGGQGRAGLPVVEVKLARGNTKEELGNIVATEFEGQRALIPGYGPWLDAWLEEHKSFPYGQHDDWVETTIVALWYLLRREPLRREQEPVRVYGSY